MAHLYIFSPSGAVADKSGFKRGVRQLQAMGHEVEIDVSALSVHQRFAGDDDERLAAIGRAAASSADLCLPSRGGYGLSRIVHRLPIKAIQKSMDKGTQWMGFSDFTAFQLGVWAGTGQSTWAGCHLIADFGSNSMDEVTLACFNDVLERSTEGTGWRLKRHDSPFQEDVQLARGARLWGGNLAVLNSLQGSDYFPKIKKGVLYLEDVGEHPYRLERLLLQLHHSGVLNAQQLILLGQFTHYNLAAYDKGFRFESVVNWLRTQTKTPIVTGLPFGHVPTKVCLPFGKTVDVVQQGKEVMMFWGRLH